LSGIEPAVNCAAQITLVVAVAEDGVIGAGGEIHAQKPSTAERRAHTIDSSRMRHTRQCTSLARHQRGSDMIYPRHRIWPRVVTWQTAG
jgi:hypothetical protein